MIFTPTPNSLIRRLLIVLALASAGGAGQNAAQAAETSTAAAHLGTPNAISPFVHPGLLNTAADFERMRTKVAQGAEPWASAYKKLTSDWTGKQPHWLPHPSPMVVRGGPGENFATFANDIAVAYGSALRWEVSGDTAYADSAVEILNAWGGTLTRIGGDPNFQLVAINGYQLANAGEIMRGYPGWAPADFARFQVMMKRVFQPMCSDFLHRHMGQGYSFMWANWDLLSMDCLYAVGVLCDDHVLTTEATDYFYQGLGEGCIDRTVYFLHPGYLGQTQESGRDQGHNTLEIALLAPLCEMAWHQGVDLYGFHNNRVLAGAEYVAKYNLMEEVPFVTYATDSGYPHFALNTQISGGDRGSKRSGWELIYNHYVNRKGLAAPYSAAFAAKLRPTGYFGQDQPGFDTLTASLDPIPRGADPSGLTATVTAQQPVLSWWGSASATGYNVKRSTKMGGPYVTIAAGLKANTFTDTNVAASKTYFYVVTASFDAGRESGASNEASAILGTWLYAHLKFNETSATMAADSTGKGRSGALVNSATWTTGKIGGAVNLDSAAKQYVAMPVGVGADLSDFTIAAWVNLGDTGAWSRIFDFGTGTERYMFLTPKNGDGKVAFSITGCGGNGEQRIVGVVLPTGQWVHIAVTVSGSTGTLYVDGVQVGQNQSIFFTPSRLPTTTNNWIGRSQYDGDPYLNGKVDDFRIYRGALDAAEVRQLAAATPPEASLQTIPGLPAKPIPRPVGAAPQHEFMIQHSNPETTLWYQQPADTWIKALPVGNGRLGAMIFGQPEHEKLQLNDVTIWSGNPQPDADRKDAYKSLPELRQLIRDGHYDLAAKFARAHFNGPAPYANSYQTLGDLNLEFVLPEGEITDYQRQLNIGQAFAGVRFKVGGVQFSREIFSSAPDHVLVQHLAADHQGALTFSIKLGRVERAKTVFLAPDTLVMTGDTGNTLGYEVRARVLTSGGTITGGDGTLSVAHADEATILLTCATTFVLDYDKGYKGGDLTLAAGQLAAAAAKSYAALKAAHTAEYQGYFNRLHLQLGNSKAALPTDERLKAYGDGKADPGFAALFYNYGRYLLISSSRPDNPLPSNSQGIWGDGLQLPWQCDYKANINYQMNYWPAEPANLSEMHAPMLRMTQNLVKPGTKTAQAYFGPETPGWVVGYTTNGWSWTSPGEALPWGIWFGGSGWMCQHLWEHYAFTRDEAYLRSVYPTLKGAAQFWLANLVEGPDGKLITSPSTSPENDFITDTGIKSNISEGATMEKSIVWDLLNNTAAAARVLHTDPEFRARVEAARDRIEPIGIGKRGQVMEWNGDWDDPKSDHRHVSHLFGLHPGHEISVLTTPKLADAARVTLAERGDDGTGWSLAWKINFWARLREGDHALKLMANQLRYTERLNTVMQGAGGTYPNLFDAHPPFQIDGNFGFVSGVSEMLLQSQERYADPAAPDADRYYLDLLPALPAAWSTGSVSGLRARGGFEVTLTWAAGKLASVTLHSVGGTVARVRHAGKTHEVTLKKGATLKLDGDLAPLP